MSTTFNNKTVLIVEDESFLSKILRERLEEEDFQTVQIAINGTEAVAKAKELVPDIILLDLILPNMNGFDVLQILKDEATTKDIPVIVLSNLGQDKDLEQAKSYGAEDYIIKSNFSLQSIVGKLEDILS